METRWSRSSPRPTASTSRGPARSTERGEARVSDSRNAEDDAGASPAEASPSEASAPEAIEPNVHPRRMLERYEIIAEIARGGMGAVLLARLEAEAGFERLMAIKLMHEHLAQDPGFVT